jgi:putative endonuclease
MYPKNIPDIFYNKKELGRWGEEQARNYLLENNYYLIEENYSNRWGEIDLVVSKGDFIVFVEVKTRRSNKFGPPEASVNYKKQSKIRKMATFFTLRSNYSKLQVRFDVITVFVNQAKESIDLNHIKNAF